MTNNPTINHLQTEIKRLETQRAFNQAAVNKDIELIESHLQTIKILEEKDGIPKDAVA